MKRTDFHDREKVCHYCYKEGHVRADCYVLKNKLSNVKSAALAATVVSLFSDLPCPQCMTKFLVMMPICLS